MDERGRDRDLLKERDQKMTVGSRGRKKSKKKKKVSGTKEWAATNVNIQSGCSNDCVYCYAKAMAIRFGREACESWKEITLKRHKLDEIYKKREGTIMFPTTHDITEGNLDECLMVLHKLLGVGNKLLIVSKPDPKCIEKLCEELSGYKDQILFRFTIGSADNEVLKFWEPNAPSFEDRVTALKLACDLGFETSVSCEPMIDNHIETVVEKVEGYVTDAIWIGLPNRLRQIVSVNCGKGKFAQEVDELLGLFTEDRIMELYETYKDNPKVKWKESIKKLVGIEIPTQAGLDI